MRQSTGWRHCSMRELSYVFILATVCHAQVSSGILVGEVRDPSGAVVAGALITSLQETTGFSRTVSSSSAGQYSIGDLQPGTYTVTASKPGFRKTAVPKV